MIYEAQTNLYSKLQIDGIWLLLLVLQCCRTKLVLLRDESFLSPPVMWCCVIFLSKRKETWKWPTKINENIICNYLKIRSIQEGIELYLIFYITLLKCLNEIRVIWNLIKFVNLESGSELDFLRVIPIANALQCQIEKLKT